MLELDTDSKEEITEVSGYSEDSDGQTCSLASTTTAGRSWGPLGLHKPFEGIRSLRKSPAANMRFRFLSGSQTGGNWILR